MVNDGVSYSLNCIIIGCYRSGSSLLAGMLHSLGVNMGPPFWGDHFEAADLSDELRAWWSEPQLVETVAKPVRVEYLKRWLKVHLCLKTHHKDTSNPDRSDLLAGSLDLATEITDYKAKPVTSKVPLKNSASAPTTAASAPIGDD